MAANSKNTTNINTATRFFNKIDLLPGDWIKKTSTYSSKFIDEINWFLKLPEDVVQFVPAIKSINNKKTPYSITYKYLTCPTLHTQLCYSQPQAKFWKQVRKQYKALFNACLQYKPKKFIESYWTYNLKDMYINKTIERLEKASKKPSLAYWFDNKYVTINDKKYPSASTILNFFINGVKHNFEGDDLYTPFKKLITPSKSNICFIHGDPVFSNIFVYKKGKEYCLKSIDPRGSFGADKLYGDIVYDYAKVYQSVFGLYDLILETAYDFLYDGKSLKYWLHQSSDTRACQKAFKHGFFPKGLLQRIKIVEALQFLSMVPLHDDRPDHQKVFLSHGIVRLCDAIGKKWKL